MNKLDHKARVVKWIDFHRLSYCDYCSKGTENGIYINASNDINIALCHGCFDAIVELVKEKRG